MASEDYVDTSLEDYYNKTEVDDEVSLLVEKITPIS
jgi:hypothetical protein